MSKYYTPTIEELHVGFEYEIKTTNGTWVNTKANNLKLIKEIFETFQNKPIRVKHLDREDIESFGFEWNEMGLWRDDLERFMFRKEVETHKGKELANILYVPKTNWMLIYLTPTTKDYGGYVLEIPENKITIAGGTVFAGKIKNKSELKRILTQIGLI
jgi:hypothetical protein